MTILEHVIGSGRRRGNWAAESPDSADRGRLSIGQTDFVAEAEMIFQDS
jgi:hypothetical protein